MIFRITVGLQLSMHTKDGLNPYDTYDNIAKEIEKEQDLLPLNN